MSIFVVALWHASNVNYMWLIDVVLGRRQANRYTIWNKPDRWIVKNALPTSNGLNNRWKSSFSFVVALHAYHSVFIFAMINILLVFYLIPFTVRYSWCFPLSVSCFVVNWNLSKIEKKLYIQQIESNDTTHTVKLH